MTSLNNIGGHIASFPTYFAFRRLAGAFIFLFVSHIVRPPMIMCCAAVAGFQSL